MKYQNLFVFFLCSKVWCSDNMVQLNRFKSVPWILFIKLLTFIQQLFSVLWFSPLFLFFLHQILLLLVILSMLQVHLYDILGSSTERQTFFLWWFLRGTGIILFSFSSLTVWTVVLLQEKESVFLKDINGFQQQIDPSVIYFTLGISWVGTLLSWLISICFYAIHPARVGFNLRDKCHIWCFGTKIELLCSKGYYNCFLLSIFKFNKESDVDEVVASKDDIEATASCSSESEALDSTKVTSVIRITWAR